MANDNQIRLPSGQGGLTRFYDEYSSKIEISPLVIVIVSIVIMLLIIALNSIGGSFLL